MKKKHQTELRERPIKESFCIQPGCRFRGKHAQQGVCFSNEPHLLDWKKLLVEEKQILAELQHARRTHYRGKPEGFIQWLIAHYVTASLNWTCTIDDLIRLRRDLAIANDKIKRLKRRRYWGPRAKDAPARNDAVYRRRK